MALYAGEAVRVRAQITDPDTGSPFVVADGDHDPTATLALWAPGRNPVKDTEIRNGAVGTPEGPDHDGEMVYRPETSDFIVFVHTRGAGIDSAPDGQKWEPGKWTFRVRVTGNVFTNWEYGSFALKP